MRIGLRSVHQSHRSRGAFEPGRNYRVSGVCRGCRIIPRPRPSIPATPIPTGYPP